MEKRIKYSKEELLEFEELLQSKLNTAQKELDLCVDASSKRKSEDISGGNGALSFDNGSETLAKESLQQQAARQSKYIRNLENALVRIKNGTYGVCLVTGELIQKDRLRIVPHTTMSIEAKKNQ